MNATRKLLSINFRTYIVPIIVVVAIFFATDYLLVMSIRSHYMTMLETQMTSFGMIYSHSLAKGSGGLQSDQRSAGGKTTGCGAGGGSAAAEREQPYIG